jgi:penicillin G amidase
MLQRIFYGIVLLITIVFYLFLNGNIHFTKDTLPPLGKFLNPFNGAWTSDTRSEKTSLSLHMAGLKDKVEIIYDERRVPHIYAQNMEDALFAQGYVEAQNRLFQMEFLAKAAAGELSSIIGPKTIEIDLEKRRRGMKFAAENAVKGWEKTEDYNKAYRYVDGVNAFIQSLNPKDYPIEFKLFDFQPEDWTALKSALVFKQMSLTLAGRNDDLENTNLLYHLGKDDFAMLYPERQNIENPVIPTEKPFERDSLNVYTQDSSAAYIAPILKSHFENRNKGIGSNSWGVSGKKSATGKPIFCNDPHLSLGLPSIWFELHIHTPEFNVYGVSFPGFPGIMIGFNEHIAWGETNVGQDVEDLFHIEWADQARSKYVLDGQEKAATFRVEEVKVKGGKSIIDTVKYTDWGPIYRTSDYGRHDLAMRWLCHDIPKTDEYNTFIDAMKCKSYDEYLRATENYNTPAQNFGFASVSGDIALRVNGKFPAKSEPDGKFVEKGNKSANNWQAWIPRNQNPQIINPERGFIASANQVSADKTYPYYFTGKFERYRNRSVNDKLAQMSAITPDDMKKMQQDAFSYKASDFIQTIKSMISSDQVNKNHKQLYEQLLAWDYQYKAASEMPVIFDLLYKKLSENTWDELTTLQEKMDIRFPEAWRLLELIQKDPENKYFDIIKTSGIEKAHDIILLSVNETLDDFAKQKKEGKNMTWGGYKPLHIYHMTRIPAFSRMDIPADGCPDAINATGFSFGPSWRMVISLEDKVKGYAVYPGGQSGNPASQYYQNMIDAWIKGEYFDLNIHAKADDIKTKSHSIITLNPQS